MTIPAADIIGTLTTIRDYVRWASSRLKQSGCWFGHGTATALDEAVALVLYAIYQPYYLSERYFDAVLLPNERQAVVTLIEKRIKEKKPAAYLTREAVFAGLQFYVDERVLVPRSPIAELIVQRFVPWIEESRINRILDMCTGSGCIAIACAYAFPEAQVDAVDISEDALAVAEINVNKHDLAESVLLYRSDLFDDLADIRYDVIISNPPYVALSEWQQLPAEFRAEPALGFQAGETGLDLILRILIDANDFLTDHGILIVEAGSSAETLQDMFPDVPFYWLEFEHGGDGVFLLTADQLSDYQELFLAAME
jgi:ribosomal protein L3 glutamine methyltransferase